MDWLTDFIFIWIKARKELHEHENLNVKDQGRYLAINIWTLLEQFNPLKIIVQGLFLFKPSHG